MKQVKKHAYLIMAHNNLRILQVLLMLLDDERNDIYIHIDKKVKSFNFEQYKNICHNSQIIFVKKRIDIRWGRCQQTDAEMALFTEAYSYYHYDYYHLISGVDLPLKTQDEIHAFFQGYSENFISFSNPISHSTYERLSLFYHIPVKHMKSSIVEHFFRQIQRILGVNRFRKWERRGYTFEKGANWVSLTNDAVGLLIRERKTIRKMTRFSHCADEVYKQIILKKAGVPIYKDHEGNTVSMRYTDWSRGDGNHPYVFRMADYELLLGSDKLFARKFDQQVDFQIVEAIFQRITGKKLDIL